MRSDAVRPASAATATRRLRRPERRESILAAAASVFAARGFVAASMVEISAAAGVSHLIVYRHFDSKDALYESVLTRAAEHLDAALAAPNARGRYGVAPKALLESARADPDAFTVLWRHAAREPDFATYAAAARNRLDGATRDALSGRVDPTLRRWAARASVAYLVESVLVWIEDGDERLDGRFVAATDAALRAGVAEWARRART